MRIPHYSGKIFMYPCAGDDIPEPVQHFGELFDTFLFVDLKYSARMSVPKIIGWEEVKGSQRIFGSFNSVVGLCEVGRHKFRMINPAWFCTDFSSKSTGKKIKIILRRGFGQYALQELEDASLSMFMHRGDSVGEGGSGVFYLSNRRMQHQPISNLLDLILRKLCKPGLIGSDGSNTKIKELVVAANGDESISRFNSHGLSWQRTNLKLNGVSRMNVWEVYPDVLG
jgi:hypothetical protein